MRAAVFSTHAWERPFLDAANASAGHALTCFGESLHEGTAALAEDFPAVCAFANDRLDAAVLRRLHGTGTKLVCLRSVGFNHVDLRQADSLGMTVLRVPAYSPHAVAEHTIALLLAVDRKIHRAWARVREHNFALDGLLGFDLYGRTVGVIGTGRIGEVVVRILRGFGCEVLAHDPVPNPAVVAAGARYVDLGALWPACDVVTLHCPLTPATRHLVDDAAIASMRPGVVLLNTSRGAVVDSRALLAGLKSGKIGAVALDVYEEEGDLFFRDLSETVIQDDVFARLLTFPNVLVTGHQAFFTREALTAIAGTTIANLTGFEAGAPDPANRVTSEVYAR
ncbi:MAG: 2-hydroxyacid dehydrogenase [Myxococcota bacterium]